MPFYYPVETIKQDIEISSKQIDGNLKIWDTNKYKAIINWEFKQHFKIEINAKDGTFNIRKRFASPAAKSELVTPFVSIDNKINISGIDSPIAKIWKSRSSSIKDILIHRSLINNENIYELESVMVGNHLNDIVDVPEIKGGGKEYKYYNISSVVSFLNFLKPNTPNIIKTGQAIDFEFIKSIDILGRNYTTPLKSGYKGIIEDDTKSNKVDIEIKHGSILIEPTILKQGIAITKLANVYAKNISDKEMAGSLDIKIGKVKTPYGQLDLIFKRKKSLSYSNGTKKIGEIIVEGFTNYNNSTKKTTIGIKQNPIQGIMIPPEFSGNFIYSMDLTLNEVFKNINLKVSQNISKKLLDEKDGIVRLKIKYENKTFKESKTWSFYVSNDDIDIIYDDTNKFKEGLFATLEEKYSRRRYD